MFSCSNCSVWKEVVSRSINVASTVAVVAICEKL